MAILKKNNYMKNNLIFWIITLCFMIVEVSAQAQTYEIQGRILDETTNEPLPGATVYDNANYNGAATDLEGHFRLANLKPGKTVLTISYLGYEPLEKEVNMPADNNTVVVFRLSPEDKVLTEVIVMGSFEGQQRALNQQRAADNIKNIVSADLIGKFPDKNVAEALQRLPGVNIARDKGEGSTVSIRGTPQHFTNISINGEQLASVQQSGTRTEALDLIPADQLGSIEVTKALTSDMDGDAVGGNINLRTPTARSNKLQVRSDVGMGFNDLSGKLNYIGKLQLSRRFFADANNQQGRLGLLASGSYYGNNNSEDRMDATWAGVRRPVEMVNESLIMPEDFQFRKTENRRTRMGATFTMDYKVKNHEIIFNYMYNYREDDDTRNRLRFDFNRSNSEWITHDSVRNGRIRRDINLWNEIKNNHNFNLEGTHTLSSWVLDWGLFYTWSRRDHTSTRGDFSLDGVTIVADNSQGIMDEVPQLRPVYPLDIKNPLLLNDFRRYEEDMETTDASNLVGKFNIRKDYILSDYSGNFKFGGKARSVTNDKFRNNRVLSFFDPNGVLNREEAFAHVARNTEPIDFLNGRYQYGPRVDKEKFLHYMDTYRRLLVAADDSWDAERLSKNDTYDARENVYAAYLINRLQMRKFLLITGVRYEYNDVNYNAFDVKRSGTNVVATPINGGTNYGYLLPSVHVKYGLDQFTNIRLAYTHSYGKPNFVDIVPFINYDADAARLFVGNTDLKPSLSKNIDLMFEKYDRSGGIISAGFFYKDMNRFQFTRIVPSLIEDYPGFPQTTGFEFRQEQNGKRAIVYGFELNYMQKLDFFPGALKGLSTYLNYTFTGSDASTQDRINMRLPGQAMHTGNAALSWDYKGFSSKASLNYNGAYIRSVASNENDDIMQDDRFQLDLNLTQRITKKVSLYAEFVNITNSPSRQYQGYKDQVSRLAYFGWWTRFGITYRL